MLAFVSQLQSKNRIPYGLVWLLLIIGCNPSPDSNTGFDTIIEGDSTHFKVGRINAHNEAQQQHWTNNEELPP